jgi:hypothetical protein
VVGRRFREQGFEWLTYVRFSNRPVRENGSLLRCRSAARNEASAFCQQSRDDRFGFSDIGHLDFPFSPFAPTATGRRAKRRAADAAETAVTATAVIPIGPSLMPGSRLTGLIGPAGGW